VFLQKMEKIYGFGKNQSGLAAIKATSPLVYMAENQRDDQS
jgi:hypothetical protein